jgi:hypothetical protein
MKIRLYFGLFGYGYRNVPPNWAISITASLQKKRRDIPKA